MGISTVQLSRNRSARNSVRISRIVPLFVRALPKIARLLQQLSLERTMMMMTTTMMMMTVLSGRNCCVCVRMMTMTMTMTMMICTPLLQKATTMGIAAAIGIIAVIPGVSIITVADAVTTTITAIGPLQTAQPRMSTLSETTTV